MNSITVHGQTIQYTDTGDAGGDTHAVVFSHGALLDSSMWDEQVAELSPGFRCIAWNERHGAGQSAWDSARDLLGLLDALGISRAVLVGHSQGGFVSLRAALLAPERISALVLIDTMAAPWPAEAVAQMGAVRDGFTAAGPEAVAPGLLPGLIGRADLHDTWLAKWRAQPRQRLADTMSALLSADDVRDRLPEITAPALVAHGENDPIIPLAVGRELHAALPGAAELLIVPGAAHTPALSHPHVLAPVLRAFTAKHAG
jgi:pimeloyl-ACP methyl ester carboxylesterase